MSYIDEILNRTNIQHIRSFLLNGTENLDISAQNYKERINETLKLAMDFIRKKHPDMEEYEEIMDKVYEYSSAVQDVYMEIGLQCGFILSTQMNRKGAN